MDSPRPSGFRLKGDPIHVDLTLEGFKIGIASLASTRDDHGLDPGSQMASERPSILWSPGSTADGEKRLTQAVFGPASGGGGIRTHGAPREGSHPRAQGAKGGVAAAGASPFPGFYWAGTGDEHLGARWHKPHVALPRQIRGTGSDALGAR
jgi:hypothetical protein